jgi:hypothetical protein
VSEPRNDAHSRFAATKKPGGEPGFVFICHRMTAKVESLELRRERAASAGYRINKNGTVRAITWGPLDAGCLGILFTRTRRGDQQTYC